jgi:ribose transport system substrate-binding protein
MNWKKLIAAFVVATCFAGAALADGVDDPARNPYLSAFKGKTIAYIPNSMGFDMAQAWLAKIKKSAAELGMKVEVRDPNWNGDAMAQALTELITLHPAVIVTQNLDVQAFAKLLKQANDAGIYVIQINMKSVYPTEAFVGADVVGVGERAANLIVKQCGAGSGKSGKISIVQGSLTGGVSLFQLKGISDVLALHPEIKVVSNQAADWDASKARAITETVLQQNPDLCGIIDIWDGQAVGTAAAVKQAGRQGSVYVVTSGGGGEASCDNVRNGGYSAFISYDAMSQGDSIVDMIKVLLQSKPKAGTTKVDIYSPMTIITKENVKPNSCWSTADFAN